VRHPRLFEDHHIWVLAPSVISQDPNITYYYDFEQSILEYTRVFEELNLSWNWQYVTLHDYKEVIASIKERSLDKKTLIFNLCDGDEVNEAPGISVIRELENSGLSYTGSREYFYEITTSKIPMKRKFDACGIRNAPWEVIQQDGKNVRGLFDRLPGPLIIKPAVSGGSMGLGISNVVHNEEECLRIIDKINEGYRGWNLTVDGIFAEQFIPGKEYTSFLVGSFDNPSEIIYYKPVERVFNSKLPVTEQFLSFDRLWETYDEESALGDDQFLFNYYEPELEFQEEIKRLSLDSFQCLNGTGYTRIDIRKDERDGRCYVLEANAQCGLSEDENYTSIGAILRVSGKKFSELISEIMNDALSRKAA